MNDQNDAVSVDTITDRPSYVAWRTDWRARYAAASEAVRAAKRSLVRLRTDWKANVPRGANETYEFRINSLNERLPWLRYTATALMRERGVATEIRDALLEEARAARQAIAA